MTGFRTIRVIYIAFTIAIALSLLHIISGRSVLVVFVGFPTLAILGGSLSIFRKAITRRKSIQKVSFELLWAFVLVPFQFVVALVSTEISAAHHSSSLRKLEICWKSIIWVNCGLLSIYAVTLIMLASLTHCSYDKNVWERDIDEDPSPFPLPMIVPYLLPFTTRFFPPIQLVTPSTLPIPSTQERTFCLPGCACNRKLHLPLQPYSFRRLSSQTTQCLSRPSTISRRNLLSLSGSISGESGSRLVPVPIRMPTDMDRRRSVTINFSSSLSVSPCLCSDVLVDSRPSDIYQFPPPGE
ncbi:hypothetical protein FIBSPDRAFT_899126 [Athelia psychrophila]|uniref:Transmembrane protein n=1 Tax=Athelia psychrophila TaxID=1759441 RepID=A0A166A3V0_9AGAM|nr:hypothetical protein FIBSPDRAFT_899126 [Fibularhizoctonia sp. CBS 109695]